MSNPLSASDLGAAARAARLLASPLDLATVNDWRSTVNAQLRVLLRADSAGFLLPVPDGPLFYSDEHDPAKLARYPELNPPSLSDGRTIWERGIELGVATLDLAYGADIDRYLRSAYYHEYALPNGAADTLCAMLPLGRPDPHEVAAVQLWRGARTGRRFGDRELDLLRLLAPALQAGVDLLLRWGPHGANLARTLDGLGGAVLVCDAAGRSRHRTPALEALLASEPEARLLLSTLERTAHALAAAMRGQRKSAPGARVAPAGEVHTATARYIVRGCLHAGAAFGLSPIVLVSIERLSRLRRSDEELIALYRLTPAEVRVAVLLARGCSNAAVAATLGISAHTARRHTERVLSKLDVKSRAQVAGKLSY